MKMYTDHYFHIGHSHLVSGKPCQDFALSSELQIGACAVVSDGCSTGRHTDVGARITTLGTIAAIRGVSSLDLNPDILRNIRDASRERVQSVSYSLNLEKSDLLATCLFAITTPTGGYVQVLGDGVVAFKYSNGKIVMHRFDWAMNAPFYPVYDSLDAVVYIENLHRGLVDSAQLSHRYVVFENNVFSEEVISSIPFASGRDGVQIPITADEITSDLEFVATFSDGITQIENVDWKDAVQNLLDFKSLQGEFAKRRMIRAIKNYQHMSKGPLDDISYAVIRIDHTE